MAIALLVIGLATLGVTGVTTVVFGGLLVLVVPGYGLCCVLWGSKSDLSIADRVAFTVGLSVSLSMFDVLALSLLGIGIFPLTVTVALGYETVVFCVLALVFRIGQRQGLPDEIVATAERMRAVLRADRAFWTVIGVLLLTAGILIALTVSVPTPPPGTQFYVLGPDGTDSSLPTNLAANESASILVGAYNGEPQAITFNITVCLLLANRSVGGSCPGPSSVLAKWTSVLPFLPNGTYHLNLTVAGGGRSETPLQFTIVIPDRYVLSLALDGGGVQREVRLPLNVSG